MIMKKKNTIVEKLSIEIEAFLQAKQPVHSGNNNKLASKAPKESSLHRHSLESFHLNDAASAPRNGDYEEDSTGSGFNSFELKRDSSGKRSNGCSKQPDDNGQEKKNQSREVLFKGSDGFSLQKQFTEHISRALSNNGNKTKISKGEPGKEWEDNQDEGYNYQKSETSEVTQEVKRRREKKRAGSHEFNSGQMLHSLSRKGGKLRHEQHHTEDSLDQSAAFTSDPSIKQQRMPRIAAPEPDTSESFRKGPQGIKDHSLKARLFQAKLESQQSRMKTSKGPL